MAAVMAMTPDFWSGRRVFVTGHTGFKGGWLALWLAHLGAEVHGFALPPATDPNFYDVCGLETVLASNSLADIAMPGTVLAALKAAQPEVVLHLAAQAFVRQSYQTPVETFDVNVMGTVRLLEAVRQTPSVRAVVNVTTDKCYENREWVWPYREDEAMGGYDPYSASKACSELVSAAYRRSFLETAGVRFATARAGNVIGGGDWSQDRLVPDILRAFDAGRPVPIRSPHSVRPWQHVLDPLAGYLTLAERLVSEGSRFAEAWNFGPSDHGRSVQWIVERMCAQLPGTTWDADLAAKPHEAHLLRLDSSKARALLGWSPRWPVSAAIDQTLAWHKAWKSGTRMADFSRDQIAVYEAAPTE